MAKSRRGFGSIRKLPSGRFQARYSGPDGNEYKAPDTFARKNDADIWLSRVRTEIAEGKWNPRRAGEADENARITFEDWSEQWLALLPLQKRTPKTIQTYKYRIGVLREEFGAMMLSSITQHDISRWYAKSWENRGPGVTRPLYMTLSSCFNAAAREGFIDESPCKVVAGQVHVPTKDPDRVRVATPMQVRQLSQAMPEPLQLAPMLAAWCQYREGELLACRRRDFDLDKGEYTIERQVQFLTGEGAKYLPPKSKSGIRRGTIPAKLIPLIQAHLDTYVDPDKDALLFPRPKDKRTPTHPNTLRAAWDKARITVGLDGFVFHDLRHTGLTIFAQQGATAAELLERGGHTSIEVAMRYQHATKERDRTLTEHMNQKIEI